MLHLPPSLFSWFRVLIIIGGVAGLLWLGAKFLSHRQLLADKDASVPSTRAAHRNPVSQTPPAEKGTINESGIFRAAMPDFVSPDYQAASVDPSTLKEKAAELVVGVSPDLARIGLVTIDRRSRSISFPARLNMQSGLIEYALVNAKGKAHEALLTTEALPLHVHLAALLLEIAKPEGNGEPAEVSIEVEWQPNGPSRRVPLESLVAHAKGVPLDPVAARRANHSNQETSAEPGNALKTGPWNYSGSFVRQGALMAAVEGSVISLLNDPAALICNPRPGNNNDRLHVPGSPLPPALNFPVVVHIHPFSRP